MVEVCPRLKMSSSFSLSFKDLPPTPSLGDPIDSLLISTVYDHSTAGICTG